MKKLSQNNKKVRNVFLMWGIYILYLSSCIFDMVYIDKYNNEINYRSDYPSLETIFSKIKYMNINPRDQSMIILFNYL